MKAMIGFILVSFICSSAFSQSGSKSKLVLDPKKKVYQLETACGTCKFKMKGDDCTLAVMYKGYPYFVEGTGIDDHGDAHAKNGFCNAVRMANVQGKLVGNKFVVSYFEMLPEKTAIANKP